ncbi:MAG: hypothetical protein ACOZDY_13285 [Pseudomonadota bacterium]
MARQPKKKILVGIWKPLIDKLSEATAAACLQRDAFLDRVLRHEAAMLDKEITKPNSEEAKAFLSRHLALLDRHPVSLHLSEETVSLIDKVCGRKNVLRDCFVNRVILFLVGKQPDLFKRLVGFDYDWYLREHVLADYSSEFTASFFRGNLKGITELISEDPFWAVRMCIDAAQREKDPDAEPALHSIYIPQEFFKQYVPSALGLNCHLEDFLVDGHPAAEALRQRLDDLFDEPAESGRAAPVPEETKE